MIIFAPQTMAFDQLDDEFVDQKEMSFFDHIDAFRGHIVRSVIAILVLAIAAFFMHISNDNLQLYQHRHTNTL